MNEAQEFASVARGIFKQLADFRPCLPALVSIAPAQYHPMLDEFATLCDRAAAISPDGAVGLAQDFLTFCTRYDLLARPSKGN
jgi:hypothetical protein